jgi:hypothetical protein
VLTDNDVDRIVPNLARRTAAQKAISARGKAAAEENEPEALKRHLFDAKKAIKNFIKHQKRSKILTFSATSSPTKKTVNNLEENMRFLIELE